MALIVGFILLSWQLQKQHDNTLETNRRQAQDRLKLDIFSEIAKRIEATRVPLTDLGLVPTGFVGELIIRRWSGAPSRYQFADLQDVSKKASDSVISLMAVLEIYEIAMSDFEMFRERLANSSRSGRVAFGDFTSLASGFLGTLTREPNPAESAELSRLADITQRAAIEVTGVVWDLRVAAQNYLLGGLFPDRRVPERTPGDPSVVVTTLPKAG